MPNQEDVQAVAKEKKEAILRRLKAVMEPLAKAEDALAIESAIYFMGRAIKKLDTTLAEAYDTLYKLNSRDTNTFQVTSPDH